MFESHFDRIGPDEPVIQALTVQAQEVPVCRQRQGLGTRPTAAGAHCEPESRPECLSHSTWVVGMGLVFQGLRSMTRMNLMRNRHLGDRSFLFQHLQHAFRFEGRGITYLLRHNVYSVILKALPICRVPRNRYRLSFTQVILTARELQGNLAERPPLSTLTEVFRRRNTSVTVSHDITHKTHSTQQLI